MEEVIPGVNRTLATGGTGEEPAIYTARSRH